MIILVHNPDCFLRRIGPECYIILRGLTSEGISAEFAIIDFDVQYVANMLKNDYDRDGDYLITGHYHTFVVKYAKEQRLFVVEETKEVDHEERESSSAV